MPRTINNTPQSLRLNNKNLLPERANRLNNNRLVNKGPLDNLSTEVKNKIAEELNPELEKKINDPDFQLDRNDSDDLQLDKNLNTLMALVRLAIGKIQQTKKEHKKLKLTEEEGKVMEKIGSSKNETLHQARISFAQGIATLAFSIVPVLPELRDMQNFFKGISDTSQLVSTTFNKGSEAVVSAINNHLSLGHQKIQKLNNEERSPLQNAEEMLSRLSSEMRVN